MITFENITKRYGDLYVLRDFSLSIEENKVTCLFGPSGCGKTTILKILAGLDNDYTGNVSGRGNIRISFVFQENRLIPWLSVYDNMKFVLEGVFSQEQLHDNILRYLKKVNLEKFETALPSELSSGMKQRLSIARALAYPHELLVLDEPFQGLDPALKNELLDQLENLLREDKKTVVMVTHDMSEARRLAHRIVFLSGQPLSAEKIEILK